MEEYTSAKPSPSSALNYKYFPFTHDFVSKSLSGTEEIFTNYLFKIEAKSFKFQSNLVHLKLLIVG